MVTVAHDRHDTLIGRVVRHGKLSVRFTAEVVNSTDSSARQAKRLDASVAFERIRPKIEAIPLPVGYEFEWGGEYEGFDGECGAYAVAGRVGGAGAAARVS